jgi:hypothetical protein
MLALRDSPSPGPSAQELAQLLGNVAGSPTHDEIEQNLSRILWLTRLTFDLPAGAGVPLSREA